MANISKRERGRRPTKPEFAWTGVVIGLFLGWLMAVAVEFSIGQPKMIIMFAGGIGGVLLGIAVESIRYWWRLRQYQALRKS